MKFTSSLGLTLSGSQGGVTAARNRGGQYFRRRAVPTNPNTVPQQGVRSAMTALVAGWQALSSAERAAWTTYAQNTPGTDSLGQTLVLTGQQAYIRSNAARLYAGIAVVDAAPTVYNRGEPVTSAEVWDPNTAGDVTVGLAVGASDDGDVLAFVGRPVSAARNFYKGPYRYVGQNAIAAAATSANVLLNLPDPYGEPYVAGQIRPVRFVVAYDDGRVSQGFELLMTVVS